MPISEAKRRADAKYAKKAYDQVTIRIHKGKRDQYKQFAEEQGESLSSMIQRLIEEEMSRKGYELK